LIHDAKGGISMQSDVEMNVYEAILARRSVRRYTPQTLDRNTVRLLLEAAVHAPTAMHDEPWAFAVFQDKDLLRQLSDRAKPLFVHELRRSGKNRSNHSLDNYTDPDFNIFYDAGTLIVICANALGPFVAADCWLAAENLMLAACAMELGSCVIGSALPALNTASIKAELGIPEKYSVIAPIVVGYPEGETEPMPRKEPFILNHLSVEQQ
jgi:nitroreductase